MSHGVVANFPLRFKSNLIFDRIDVLPNFIDLLLGSGNTKLVFRFGKCNPVEMLNVEFVIVGSGGQHRFARTLCVEKVLVRCVWSM
jgi:hypothetical protein